MHRIGQSSRVNIHVLMARHSIDEMMWDMLQRKLEDVGRTLDGQEDGMKVGASAGGVRLGAGRLGGLLEGRVDWGKRGGRGEGGGRRPGGNGFVQTLPKCARGQHPGPLWPACLPATSYLFTS